uniref:Uncharacterized protein n=1 Tax=Timema tahoe TaxID=61484 RepID=A0A7R9IM70_9NEOP|nr:unnamed protein product [Timema tahoe]
MSENESDNEYTVEFTEDGFVSVAWGRNPAPPINEVALRVSHSFLMSSDRIKPRSGIGRVIGWSHNFTICIYKVFIFNGIVIEVLSSLRGTSSSSPNATHPIARIACTLRQDLNVHHKVKAHYTEGSSINQVRLHNYTLHLSSSSSASSSSPPLYTCPSISSSSSSSPATSAFSASARSICLASSASSVAVTTLGCIKTRMCGLGLHMSKWSTWVRRSSRQTETRLGYISPFFSSHRFDTNHNDPDKPVALHIPPGMEEQSRPLVEIFQLLIILVVQEFRHMAQDGVDSLCFGKPLCALLHILGGHSSLAQKYLIFKPLISGKNFKD